MNQKLIAFSVRDQKGAPITFDLPEKLPLQPGINGFYLNNHLKFSTLKEFEEKRETLMWVCAGYAIVNRQVRVFDVSVDFWL